MPHKMPPIHGRFVKGKSGNPEGARKHNHALKKLRKASRADVEIIADLIQKKTPEQLYSLLKAGKLKGFAALVVSVFVKACTKGDAAAMEKLFREMVGPVREEFNLYNPDGTMAGGERTVIVIPDNGRDPIDD